jgi:hypothetical protein
MTVLWRGSLLPLGRAAALKSATAFYLTERTRRICDRYAVEREQAPSPQLRMPSTERLVRHFLNR